MSVYFIEKPYKRDIMTFKFKTNIKPVTHADAIFQWKEFMKDSTSGPGWQVYASGTGLYDSSIASHIRWKLDEVSGFRFVNSGLSGSNDINSYGSFLSGVESFSGKGVKFNGTDGYLYTDIQPNNPDTTFTLSFFVNVHDVKSSYLICRGQNSGSPDVAFRILNTSGDWQIDYSVGGTLQSIAFNLPTDTKILSNENYLLSFTYGPTSVPNTYSATAYISSSSVTSSKNKTHGSSFSWSNSARWFIGSNFGGTDVCSATISDVCIENVARSASHFTSIFNLNKNSYLNWKLDEQVGISKFSNSGTDRSGYLSSNVDSPEYYNAGHTVTKLNNGNVLVIGGPRSDAYILDSVDGTFSKTGSLSTSRSWHTATLLKDGYVLITGGDSYGSFGDGAYEASTTSAELYNPSTGTFQGVGSLSIGRASHTATLITSGSYDGYVLIAGGCSSKQCELYNPTTKSFTSTSSMKVERSFHTATSLGNGKIILVGGSYAGNSLSSTEIFDTTSMLFESGSTPSLTEARSNHTATLLLDGSVIFLGGEDSSSQNVSTVEKYVYGTGFTTLKDSGNINLSIPRSYHSSVLLGDGKVLITGGIVDSKYTKTSVLLDPISSGNPTTNLNMLVPRAGQKSVLMKDLSVTVIGGCQDGSNSEVFDVVTGNFRQTNQFVSAGTSGILGNSLSIGPNYTTKIYLPFNSDLLDISSSSLSVNASAGASLSSSQSKSGTKSCLLNGTNGYLSFVPGFTLSGSAWIVDTWIYPKSINNSYSTIISRSNNTSLDWEIQINSSSIVFRTNNDVSSNNWANNTNSRITESFAFSANNWYHIIAKYDGAALSIFVNDTNKPIVSENISITSFGGTSAQVCIGCKNYDSPSNFFYGHIDNLRISCASPTANVTLSQSSKFNSFSETDSNTAIMVKFNDIAYSSKANVTSENPYTTNTYTNINWKMEEGVGERIFGFANILKNNYSDKDPWVKGSTDLVAKEYVSTVRNNMAYARYNFSATILSNGKVLIVGGNDGSSTLSTAEVYDPLTKTFSSAGSLNYARESHAAVLLSNGKVLISCGKNGNTALTTSEIFDPIANTFANIASTISARYDHSSVLLDNGSVLFVGGNNGSSSLNDGYLFSSSTNQYSYIGTFSGARSLATVTKLSSGNVLICGGLDSGGTSIANAVIYNALTSTFGSQISMQSARYMHTATLLPNGKVIVVGGIGSGGSALSTTEIFNPTNNTFVSSGSITEQRSGHTATALNDGYVLIAGGLSGSTYHSTARVFNPNSETFGSSINMTYSRVYASSVLLVDNNANGLGLIIGGKSDASTTQSTAEIFTLSAPTGSFSVSNSGLNMEASVLVEDPEIIKLPSGNVLVTGGNNGGSKKSTQVYDPTAGTISAGPNMTDNRVGHFAVGLKNNKVVVGGGYDTGTSYPTSIDVYDPTSGTYSSDKKLSSSRYLSGSALLDNGRIIISGGKTNSSVLDTVEIYNSSYSGTGSLTPIDSNTNVDWKFDESKNPQFFQDSGYGKQGTALYSRDFPKFVTSSLVSAAADATYTQLLNGKILITGGGADTTTAQLFDPTTGLVTQLSPMLTARSVHTASLLLDGRVLVVGIGSAEIYDPSTEKFTAIDSAPYAYSRHISITLNNGKVIIAGGVYNSTGIPTSLAQLFDPNTQTFTYTGSMSVARSRAKAILLKNGKVLVLGGQNSNSVNASYDLYDPSTGTFTSGSCTGRVRPEMVLLNDGNVLVCGGNSGMATTLPLATRLSSAEIYNVTNNTFSATNSSMTVARDYFSAIKLDDGYVLMSGGGNSAAISSAELYDPTSNTFYSVSSMSSARYSHQLFKISSNKVVAIGYNTAIEIYDLSAKSFSENSTNSKSGASISRQNPEIVSLGNNKIFVTGGTTGATATYSNTTEIYDSSAGTTSSGPNMSSARVGHVLQPITSTKFIVAGGASSATTYLNTAQIFDSASSSFTSQVNMSSARYGASATSFTYGGFGKVLITGGYATSGSAPISTAEVYTDGSGFTNTTNSMASARSWHSSTSLSNGKILIVGGIYDSSGNATNTADIYDPSTGSFTRTSGDLNFARCNHSANLITTGIYDGYVLISGGKSSSSSTSEITNSEIYNPSTGTFSVFTKISSIKDIDEKTIIQLKLDESSAPFKNTGSYSGYLIVSTAGSVTTQSSGVDGYGISLPGSSSHITMNPYSLSGEFTVSMWVYLRSYTVGTGTNAGFFINYNNTSATWSSTSTPIGMYLKDTTSGCITVRHLSTYDTTSTTEQIQRNKWVLLSATNDGSYITFYMNGKRLRTAGRIPTSSTINWDSYDRWYFGGFSGATNCIIDDIRIENVARSDDYLYELYISGVSSIYARSEHSAISLPNKNILISGGKSSSTTLQTALIFDPQILETTPLNMTYSTYGHRTIASSSGDIISIGGTNGSTTYRPVQLLNSSNSRSTTTGVSGSASSISKYTSLSTKNTTLAPAANSCTISLWTNIRSYVPNSILIAKKFSSSGVDCNFDGAGYGFMVKLTTDGYWQYTSDRGLYSISVTDSASKISLNVPTLISVVNNGSYTYLYKDGVKVAEISQPSINFGYGAWSVGSNASSAAYSIDGYIQDVRIENTVRNSTYLANLFSNPSQTIDSNTIINWKLNESADVNILSDSGTNSGLSLTDKDYLVAANPSLTVARYSATYTKLLNGKILIAGGRPTNWNSGTPVSTAEVYDPYTGIISPTENMKYARARHSAALLNDGKVLIVGGTNGTSGLQVAEVYDPSTNKFTVIGNMVAVRNSNPTAVTMSDGKVLIAGGNTGTGATSGYLNTAEIYDPSNNTFTATTGNMGSARDTLAATLLSNGKVLIFGGWNGTASSDSSLSTCELYNPSTQSFTQVSMSAARRLPSVCALQDGYFLVSGGWSTGADTSTVNTAEIYDTTANSFSNTSGNMTVQRGSHSSVKLTDGYILLSGSWNGTASANTSEKYNPTTKTFSSSGLGTLSSARHSHSMFTIRGGKVVVLGGPTAIEIYDNSSLSFSANTSNYKVGASITGENREVAKLNDGSIFVAGGVAGTTASPTYLNTTSVYNPSDGSVTAGPNMSSARKDHFSVKLSDGNVLVGGGMSNASTYLSTAQIYTPVSGAAGSFSNTTNNMVSQRALSKAVTLNDGRVLITGGHAGSTSYQTAEIYSGGSFGSSTYNMVATRHSHTVTKLNDGYVLIVGGANKATVAASSDVLSSAELFDPSTNTFTAVGSLNNGRYNHTSTLLDNGMVLIVGGQSSTTAGDIKDAEIYNPYTKKFSYAGSVSATINEGKLNTGRSEASAILLPNKNVLISGGKNSSTILSDAEIYDYYSNTFTAINIINSTYRHRSVLSDAGDVVVVGGSDGAATQTYRSIQLINSSSLVSRDSGADGYAVLMSGTGSIVSESTTTSPTSNEFTISLFIMLTNYNSNGVFVAKKYSSGYSESSSTAYAFAIKQTSNDSGKWHFVCNNGAFTLESSTDIQLNKLTHIAVTNGSAGTKLYVNGVESGSSSRVTVDFGSGPWSIGSNASSGLYASSALIDEVRVESVQRTSTYIMDLCNSRSGSILLTQTMTSPRWGHTVTSLPTVKDPVNEAVSWSSLNNALIIGGATNLAGTAATSSIDLYNPVNVSQPIVSNGNLSVPRYNHSVTVLYDYSSNDGYQYYYEETGNDKKYSGYVVVIGGKNPGASPEYPTSVEICHASFSGSSIIGNIQVGREKCCATLLPNGNILITGGYNAAGPVSTSEIFDVYSGTSTLVNMPYPTQKHRSVLADDKNVVLIGGSRDSNGLQSSYLKTQLLNASSIRRATNGIYGRTPTAQEWSGSVTDYHSQMNYNRWVSNTSGSKGANKVNKLTFMSTENAPNKTPSSDKFTISLWVYLTSYTSNAILIAKKLSSSSNENDPLASGYALAIKQTNNGGWQVITAGQPGSVILNPSSTSKIQLNTWTLISVTNNGYYTKAYINGAPACSPSIQLSVDFGTGPWSVASNPSSNTYAMDGYIDDVRIESTVRTCSYLRNLYVNTVSPSSNLNNLFEDNSVYSKDIVPYGSTSIIKGKSVSSGYAGYFNGTDGYVEFTPNFSLSNKAWTIESWIYPKTLNNSSYQTISSCGTNWGLSLNSVSIKFFTGSTPTILSGNYSITNNSWHHVAASHDGSTLRLFVDGYQVASGSFSIQSYSETDKATIGCKNITSASELLDGYLDDFRVITNRALYRSSFSLGGDGVIGNNVTLSCWICPSNYGSSESGLVYKLLDNNSWSNSPKPTVAMGISLDSSGNALNYISVDGVVYKNTVPGVKLDRWSLLTMTFNGVDFKSYLNDAQITSQSLSLTTGNIDWGNHGSWFVGSFPETNTSLNTKICDVRLESSVRSLVDVKSLYDLFSKDIIGSYSSTQDLITSKDKLNKYSWFVLKSKSALAERHLSVQMGDNSKKWRLKYSTSQLKNNPSHNVTPSSTGSLDESVIYGGGTDSNPTFRGMFSGLSENNYRLQMGADDGYNRAFFFAYNHGDIASENNAKTMFLLDSLEQFSGSKQIVELYPTKDSDPTIIGVINNSVSEFSNIKYLTYSSDYSGNNFHRLKGFVAKGIASKQSFVNIAMSSWGPIINFNGSDGYDGYAWSPSLSQAKNPHTSKYSIFPVNYFYKNSITPAATNEGYKGSSAMVYTVAGDISIKNWDKFTINTVGDKLIVNGFVLPWDNSSLSDS